jgi:hypothetical protein
VPTSVAPPKTTGGGGFGFEDDVCASLLASMLAGSPPFDEGLGLAERIDFQTRPDGWLLDDVLVTAATGPVQRRIAISIKSNAQFSGSTAPKDFVRAIWEQWLHVDSRTFEQSTDVLMLLTATIEPAVRDSLKDLVDKAIAGDPVLLTSRIPTRGWTNATERHLFTSLSCPADLATSHQVSEYETANLLRCLRFRQCDFGTNDSGSEKAAIDLCSHSLRNGTRTLGQSLWTELRRLAGALRPKAGSLTRLGLVDRLRANFDLTEFPDHRSDWRKLANHCARAATQVPNTIADRFQLSREADVDTIQATLIDHHSVALVGASGIGKSAVARALFERRGSNDERTLWFEATDFDGVPFGVLESSLGLSSTLVLTASTPRQLFETLQHFCGKAARRRRVQHGIWC